MYPSYLKCHCPACSDPEGLKKKYEDRLKVFRNLTDSIYSYLSYDIQIAIDSLSPHNQVEDKEKELEFLMSERDRVTKQLEDTITHLETIPEQAREIMKAAISPMLIDPLKRQIEQIEERIDEINEENPININITG